MAKLFLDDKRTPDMVYEPQNAHGWTIVKSYDEFCKYITENGIPALISFDHDLGEFREIEGETVDLDGNRCAEFLKNYCLDNNIKQHIDFRVHSANPGGHENIFHKLTNLNKHNGFTC